jgi:hypothetical protein
MKLRLFGILLMFCAALEAQVRVTDKDLGTQRIIARRTNSYGSETVIAVNRDDVVHELDKGKGDKDFIIAANLGTRITASGNLGLEQALPKQNVPVAAKRITFPNGVIVHIVLAWGFNSAVPNLLEPYCKLFVIREDHGTIKGIVEEELGTQLIQFIVEDLSGDGKYEVLITAREGSQDTMDVWQIHSSEITKLQTIGGYQVSTISDRFMDSGFEVLVEEKAEDGFLDKVCYSATQYKWSPQSQRFVKEAK